MTFAHIMGIPVEESILPLVPAGTAIITAVAIVSRTRLRRLAASLRRREPDRKTDERHEAHAHEARRRTARARRGPADGTGGVGARRA
jgi:hypothetical protein